MAAIYKPVKAQQGNDSIGIGWYYEMYQSGGDFHDIKNRAQQFFDTHPDYDTSAELKRQYLDWLNFWESRSNWSDSASYPGDLSSAVKAMNELANAPKSTNTITNLPDWKLISPNIYSNHNLGIVTCSWVDPNNANHILIGTEASGLWETKNATAVIPDWKNLTDSYVATSTTIPIGFGVSSIVVKKGKGLNNSLDIIIVSTYLSNTDLGIGHGLGILVSFNSGGSWMKANIGPNNPVKDRCWKVINAEDANNDKVFASCDGKVYEGVVVAIGAWGFGQNPIFDIQAINPCSDPSNGYLKRHVRDMEVISSGTNKTLFITTDGFITGNVKCNAKIYYSDLTSTTYQWQEIVPSAIISNNNTFVDNIEVEKFVTDFGRKCFFAYDVIQLTNGTNNITDNETFYIDKYLPSGTAWIKATSGNYIYSHNYNFWVGYPFAGMGFRHLSFKIINEFTAFAGGYELHKIDLSNSLYERYGPSGIPVFNEYCHYGIRHISTDNGNNNLYLSTEGGISKFDLSNFEFKNINGKGLAIAQVSNMSTSKYSKHDVVVYSSHRNGLWRYKCDNWDNFNWGDGGSVLLDENDQDMNDYGQPDYIHNITSTTPVWMWSGDYIRFENCLVNNANPTVGLSINTSNFQNEWNNMAPIVFGNNSNTVIYQGRHNIFQSTNNGATWTPITTAGQNGYPLNNGDYWTGKLGVIKVAPNNPNIMYIAFKNPSGVSNTTGKFFRGIKQGSTWNWTDLSPLINTLNTDILKYHAISDIAVNPNNSSEAWLTIDGFKGNSANAGDCRVIHLKPNGIMEDFSQGLTMAPANCLVYNEANTITTELFVGTDVGVFYRDGNTWVLYHNNNHPQWIVKKLEINYNTMMLRAATWGRSVWETHVYCESAPPHNFNITHSNYPPWNTPLSNVGNIEIHNGGVLTINANVEMAKDRKITVKRGGKLIVNNAKISGYCQKMWEGIILDGNSNLPQTHNDQGRIELNNATIEDAVIAIKSIDLSFPAKGGGVVTAVNSTFRNNQIAVKMLPYAYKSAASSSFADNHSSFKKCNFITDEPLKKYPLKPIAFISLDKINNLKVLGCSFKNINTDCNGFTYEGIGIDANDSYINVTDYCSYQNPQLPGTPCPAADLTPSEFSFLNYGIKAKNGFGNTFQVNNTKFYNNKRGLYLDNISNFYLLSNTFQIPYSNILYSYPEYCNIAECYYGVYLNSCQNNYRMEANTFAGVPYPDGNGAGFIGLYVYNSEKPFKMIYNNTFNSLRFALLALGYNGPQIPPQGYQYDGGLKIKCNDFIDCGYNFGVVKELNPTNPQGISYYQGSPTPNDPTKPAGNTFTAVNNTCLSTFYNDPACGNIEYFHHNDAITIPEVHHLSWGNTNVNNTGQQFNKSTACPPIYINNGVQPALPTLYSNLALAQQQLNSANLILCIWKDNGNTDALKQAVDLALPYEAYELYNELISASPYLSDEVLIKAIENEDVLPPLMLKMVLLANPHAAKSQRVMDALLKRLNPFPKVWIEELNDNKNFLTPMEQLQSEVDYAAAMREQAYNDVKSAYLYDTTLAEYATDSLIAFIKRENRLETDIEVLYMYLTNKNTDEASILYGQIPLNHNLEEEYRALLWHNTEDIYKILIDIINKNKSYADISAGDLLKLRNIAKDNYNHSAAIARNILLMADTTYSYQEPIILPDADPQNKSTKPEKIKTSAKEELMFYPNPANDFATISYEISEPVNNLQLIVNDALGKVVYTQKLSKTSDQILVVLKDYAKGNYLASIFNADKMVKSCKFVVK